MKRPYSLSIFFPSYNEEDNIVQSVREADAVAQKITDTYEIIIVDDGSKDHTGAMADRLAKEYPYVRVVHHHPNKGAGAALKSGFAAARYDYVFYTDADLQFDLNELEHLFDYIPEYEAVIGYRAPRRDPFMRIVNAWGWNRLNRILFGLKVRDIDCAFKLFKREVIQSIGLKADGAMTIAEMLIRLQRKGVIWKEVPVTHKPRHAGVPTGANPKVILRAFRELISLYRRDLGGPQAVTYIEMMKYGTVGIANTIIDVVSYVVLTRLIPFFGLYLGLAKGASFFIATIFSFLVNRSWTFGKRSKVTMQEVVKFYSVIGINLVVNVAGLSFFHSILGLHDVLAAIASAALTFLIGFVLARIWVYAKDTKETSPAPAHTHAH